jgi:hypothetical protein
LFSFDAPSAPAQTSTVEFDAFGNSPAPVTQTNVAFDAFSSSSVQSTAQTVSTFDAFGPSVSGKDQQQAHSLDDFGEFTAAPVTVMGSSQGLTPVTTIGSRPQMMAGQQNLHFSAFGSSRPPNSQAAINQISNAFEQMNVASGNVTMAMSNQPNAVSSSAPSSADDEFGEFSSANQKKSSETNNDPLSRLIQLDGLSKNQPKISNSVIGGAMGNQHVGFIQPTNPYASANSGFVNPMAPNSSLPQAGGAAVIGMMSPQVMMTPKQPTMGMTASNIGMTMNTSSGFQNMQMGSVAYPPQMMMTQNQGGMTYVNPGMVGGMAQSGVMMNPSMMQQQGQQGGMNAQMMQGSMTMSGDMVMGGGMMGGNMTGGMMGGNMTGGMMGGQSMQGWR